MFQRFHSIIKDWLEQEKLLPILETLYLPLIDAQETNPDNRTLWKNYLHAVLPPDYAGVLDIHSKIQEDLLNKLTGFSNYTIERKVLQLLKTSVLRFLNQKEQKYLTSKILNFQRQLNNWAAGKWHTDIKENRYAAFRAICSSHKFEDRWSCASFLSNCGYLIPSSKHAFLAWLKWSGEKNPTTDYDIWCNMLKQLFPDHKNSFKLDKILGVVFSPNSILKIPNLCQTKSSCFTCPLSKECKFFQRNLQDNQTFALENRIRAGIMNEITKEELLVYLAGERWFDTERQQSFLSSFPVLAEQEITDFDPESDDEKFFLFLKCLKELLDRPKQIETHTDNEPITGSRDIFEQLRYVLGKERQETFYTLILDNKHRKILLLPITRGTLNQSLVHPREVFAPSIQLRAAAIILIHNHPSGDPKPSNQDIEITKRLSEVGKIVGINVLDHIVIARNNYYSFVDEEIMP